MANEDAKKRMDLVRRDLGEIHRMLKQARRQIDNGTPDSAAAHIDGAIERLENIGIYLGNDPNATAFQIMRDATEGAEHTDGAESDKDPAAAALGRLGGQKGGKARASKLTPERRKEIARKAAQTRWSKK